MILIIAFLALFVWALVSMIDAKKLSDENVSLEETKDTSGMQATIPTLNQQLVSMRAQLQGQQTNNISVLGPDVEHFLTIYYDNSTPLSDRLNQIKSLASDDVFQSLFPSDEMSAQAADTSSTTATCKSWADHFSTYINQTGDTTAVIFFYIANEGASLLENATAIGLPMPEKLKEVLAQEQQPSQQKTA